MYTLYQDIQRLTLKLGHSRTLPQIPHANSSILTSRANKGSVGIKHPQAVQVAVLSWQTTQRTSREAGWIQQGEVLVRGDGGEASRGAMDV
jgi:hypothetical protein